MRTDEECYLDFFKRLNLFSLSVKENLNEMVPQLPFHRPILKDLAIKSVVACFRKKSGSLCVGRLF